jgi:hypothetical protein
MSVVLAMLTACAAEAAHNDNNSENVMARIIA